MRATDMEITHKRCLMTFADAHSDDMLDEDD